MSPRDKTGKPEVPVNMKTKVHLFRQSRDGHKHKTGKNTGDNQGRIASVSFAVR